MQSIAEQNVQRGIALLEENGFTNWFNNIDEDCVIASEIDCFACQATKTWDYEVALQKLGIDAGGQYGFAYHPGATNREMEKVWHQQVQLRKAFDGVDFDTRSDDIVVRSDGGGNGESDITTSHELEPMVVR